MSDTVRTPEDFPRIEYAEYLFGDPLLEFRTPFIGRHSNRLSRHQHNQKPSTPTPLDKLNDRLQAKNLTLHPTKGYRKINPRRTFVALIVAAVKAGKLGYEVSEMKRQLGEIK